MNNGAEVELIDYHGSAHIRSLENATGLLKVDKGVSEIAPGSEVNVRQI